MARTIGHFESRHTFMRNNFYFAPRSSREVLAGPGGSDTAVVDRDLGCIPAGQEGLAGEGHVGSTRW